jgi:cyanophycinase
MRRRMFLAGCSAALAQTPSTYFLTGSAADAHATTSPGYVLMGGGKDVDSAFQWLIRKSGGGDIVVIRASGAADTIPTSRAWAVSIRWSRW